MKRFLSLIVLSLSGCAAGIDSFDSATTGSSSGSTTSSSATGMTEDFCIPLTCDDIARVQGGQACGGVKGGDGCGHFLECGSCQNAKECGKGLPDPITGIMPSSEPNICNGGCVAAPDLHQCPLALDGVEPWQAMKCSADSQPSHAMTCYTVEQNPGGSFDMCCQKKL